MSQLTWWLENRKSWHKYFAVGLVFLLILGIVFLTRPSKGFVVKIDGQKIGIIKEETTFDNTVQELKELKAQSTGFNIQEIANKVEIIEVKDLKDQPLTSEELLKSLEPRLDWLVDAAAININGEPKLFVSGESEGQNVLDKLTKGYVTGDEKKQEDKIEFLFVDFLEEVSISQTQAKLSEIIDAEQALTLIKNGTDKLETYKVKKGDSLWDIAHNNNMTVTELREANPQLQKDLLSIGQELKLVKSEPLVNVVSHSQVTKEETVRYSTKYLSDSELWRGQTRVKEPGKNGKKEVTYRIVKNNGIEVEKEVLAENIIEEPQTKVVYQGTKIMVASRGGGGSGTLAWPLRGRINSNYGWRGSGFHTGLDIDGNTGDAVFSAEKGKVISAGWKGNYGYCIDIDHGDGLATRYAHLSKVLVSMGQSVNRGDLIGRVGSTGRSTGAHLHFEVRVNGSHKNPLNYIK